MKFETNWTITPEGKLAETYPDSVIIAKFKERGYYVWVTFASGLWDVGRLDINPVRLKDMHIIPEITTNCAFETLWHAKAEDVPKWEELKEAAIAKTVEKL